MCPAQKVCIYYRSQISGGDNHPGCSNSSSARTTNNLLIRIRRQKIIKNTAGTCLKITIPARGASTKLMCIQSEWLPVQQRVANTVEIIHWKRHSLQQRIWTLSSAVAAKTALNRWQNHTKNRTNKLNKRINQRIFIHHWRPIKTQ